MGENDIAMIIDIACRFDRTIRAYDLLPAHSADELAVRLMRAHEAEPLDLRWLSIADEVDLITEISCITLHFDPILCVYTGYRPRHAILRPKVH
jgi:hypothetical protein